MLAGLVSVPGDGKQPDKRLALSGCLAISSLRGFGDGGGAPRCSPLPLSLPLHPSVSSMLKNPLSLLQGPIHAIGAHSSRRKTASSFHPLASPADPVASQEVTLAWGEGGALHTTSAQAGAPLSLSRQSDPQTCPPHATLPHAKISSAPTLLQCSFMRVRNMRERAFCCSSAESSTRTASLTTATSHQTRL